MSDTKSPSQLYTQPENIKNGILIMTSSIAVPVHKSYSHGIMLLIYIFLMFIKTIKKAITKALKCEKMLYAIKCLGYVLQGLPEPQYQTFTDRLAF